MTNDNVAEYIDLYVDWLLSESVAKQFSAFKRGFLKVRARAPCARVAPALPPTVVLELGASSQVCGGEALALFRAEELELLVCGNPRLDFEALESAAKYEDGFDATSDVVRNFWAVVHEFDAEKQRALLKFVTGSDRAPIDGLAKMPFVISRNGPDSERLPTSHTCFNHLLLPSYPTREKMREKLLVAIDHTEGFGLR